MRNPQRLHAKLRSDQKMRLKHICKGLSMTHIVAGIAFGFLKKGLDGY